MKWHDRPDRKEWPTILKRPAIQADSIEPAVANILNEVKENGDEAIRKFSMIFDKTNLDEIKVTQAEMDAALKWVSAELKRAIQQAASNIEKFHRNQVFDEDPVETMPGIKCWRKAVPIEKIGLYIPGGSAPLFSTILMLGIPASIAGCREIILCSPPSREGKLDPAILYAAKIAGIQEIFKVGGAQAIAAMAYGTATIPRVYKIFGPGNQYVTCAKQLVQRDGIAIDMPAGPSELAVFADESANPSFVASDLLSQAEHGEDSQVILVTDNARIAREVEAAIELQVGTLPRKELALASLGHSKIILVENLDQAIELINEYAPEHLILACREAKALSARILNAGSVFLGHFSPESSGDYASGTNHVLPTNGYARSYSGISMDSFVKKISFQELTKQGLAQIGEHVVRMAEAEGLQAHARAVALRLEEINNKGKKK